MDSVSSDPDRALLRWLVSAPEYQELAELSVDGLRWPDNWLGLPRRMVAFRPLSPYRAQSTSVPVDVVKVLVPYDPDSGVRSLGTTLFYSSEWNLLALWVPGRGVSVSLHVKKFKHFMAMLLCVAHLLGLRWGEGLVAESRLQNLKCLLLVLSRRAVPAPGLEDDRGDRPGRLSWKDDLELIPGWWESTDSGRWGVDLSGKGQKL